MLQERAQLHSYDLTAGRWELALQWEEAERKEYNQNKRDLMLENYFTDNR